MVNIVIIKGTYGYKPQKGIVEPKCVNDPPFPVTEEEAERLIGLKVAKYADISSKAPVVPVKASTVDTVVKEAVAAVETDVEPASVIDEEILEYSIDSDVKVLRSIAKSVGINFRFGSSKVEMVEKLDEYFGEDKAPNTSVEDPVI